ncbi:hypothetical protein A3C94_03035 [Candidatus Kaiserbacteria bacterium RIFCSPHIGHO2_02_FULL_55_17]|uniref:Uncharacterized protein n=1 Tax=Candidatus Kaiserbacteria bacterium RIFCSPHIGHO2_02_FULL_55_17 TaxID=1798496 RepID=A0A1F6DTR8_9BACT|nr:MAG: hypothetical protein A3C94_03035 [Candidatus Kaiserbacteria bacterium RIFCSPHIGHO2_02_FULL_55_17]
MSEHPPKKLDLDLSNEETIQKSTVESGSKLDLDLSNEETVKNSLDVATRVAEQKERDEAVRQEILERLGVDVEATMLETGRNEAAVRQYEEQRAEEKNKEAVPFTPNVTDLEEMRAARAKQAEEDAETRDMLEKMRKTA